MPGKSSSLLKLLYCSSVVSDIDCLGMQLTFFLTNLVCQQNILKLSKQFTELSMAVMLE